MIIFLIGCVHARVRNLARPRHVERDVAVHPVVLPAGGPRGARVRPLRGEEIHNGDRADAGRQMQGNHDKSITVSSVITGVKGDYVGFNTGN